MAKKCSERRVGKGVLGGTGKGLLERTKTATDEENKMQRRRIKQPHRERGLEWGKLAERRLKSEVPHGTGRQKNQKNGTNLPNCNQTLWSIVKEVGHDEAEEENEWCEEEVKREWIQTKNRKKYAVVKKAKGQKEREAEGVSGRMAVIRDISEGVRE